MPAINRFGYTRGTCATAHGIVLHQTHPSLMPSTIKPGLIVLHGNQLEQLRAAVFEWLARHPLAALEPAIFLVQSNGVAEWLKIAIAEQSGICAATQVELPGRFLWQVYRDMLGRAQVPGRSALDRAALTWQLMRLLPALLPQAAFTPLRYFLADGDQERRLQLALRLSDLFDQYQVYRADWLNDWAAGEDRLRSAAGQLSPLAADQHWQALLWRAILAGLPAASVEHSRTAIHQRFLQQIESGAAPHSRLPRRVVLFGISALPQQTLEALAALSAHTQVLLAVPNPCQFYWGDIIDGRDLLQARSKRQPLRGDADLAAVPLEQLHAHSHPLLASWGRQGRDFIRMLDQFDSAANSTSHFAGMRIDLFSSGEGRSLLHQAQAAIRDLLPLDEHARRSLAASDRSIEFHISHSVQREVEVLHDQLLTWLAADDGLRPREVVVMVPAIDTFAAAIHAVFGQYDRFDARFIPFQIADVKARSVSPLMVALDWLLRLPQQRCQQSELCDLLDVPALATRFGLTPADLSQLQLWIAGAGVRWGLDQAHRDALGLGAAGAQNSWMFGIRRMLLGYASGAEADFAGIEPYAEVAGLDAALAGALAQLVEALVQWRALLAESLTPLQWSARARALLVTFFSASDERDRLTLAQLDDALERWLEACDSAAFEEAVPLAVVREAWLSGIDEISLQQQFVSGGVTFCTLMPMRAVPFRVVCLLGMNDGDYPRRAQQLDFDLLALPGQARPGDRSRRDDDRYLMLEALLSARDKLSISWVGRNVRDNSEQAPSVLVAQLRDYLAAGWELDLATLTTEHALQPFSRQYFEQGGLPTYASEWRAAHLLPPVPVSSPAMFVVSTARALKLTQLMRFLRQPVKYFFRERLGVVFDDSSLEQANAEPFSLDGLDQYTLSANLLQSADADGDVRAQLRVCSQRLLRQGVLPIGLIGQQWEAQLLNMLVPVRSAWLALLAQFPHAADKLPLSIDYQDMRLEHWLDQLRSDGKQLVWLAQDAGKVCAAKGAVRGEKLINSWLLQLAAAAAGHRVTAYLVARDAIVRMPALPADAARATLYGLLDAWRDGMQRPLPVACKTGLAWAAGTDADARAVYDATFQSAGEVQDLCLARLWPDFAALCAEPDAAALALQLYGPLVEWLASGVELTMLETLGTSS